MQQNNNKEMTKVIVLETKLVGSYYILNFLSMLLGNAPL